MAEEMIFEGTKEPVAEPNAQISGEVADNGQSMSGESATEATQPYRVFSTKEEWQSQIDKIIGQRLSKMRQIQAELDDYKKKEAERPDFRDALRAHTEKLSRAWDDEAAAIKGFDKKAAGENPDFVSRLKKGYSVADAYLLSNLPSLVEGAQKRALREQAERIRARSNRPSENGMGTAAAGIGRPDVGRMSNKEFDRLLKEVENGKIIS